MADKSVGEVLNQIGKFFSELTNAQRIWLGLGGVAIAATLWFFVGMLSAPKYVTLYSGLRAEEAQSLGSRLAAKNIDYQLSPDGGTLLVPADKLDASRLETASKGLPSNARLGFELFYTPNWAGSDFSEKVNYQRALEGELERTLQTLSEVEAVRVHVVLPQESVFTQQEHEAKAAVILKTRSGRLSESAQAAIPQLVASAVDRLRPENVTVVDADSNAPLVHARGTSPGGAGYELDNELGKKLLQTLEPVVGADHVRASVHVEYDLSTSEETQEVYNPNAAATLTSQKTEETLGGTTPAGIPGTASNLPGSAGNTAAAAVASTQDRQSSRSEALTYAVSKNIRRVMQPAGRLKRIAAAVLVDDAQEIQEKDGERSTTRRKRTSEEMKNIEELARAAIGIDSQRGDLLAVENMSFQELPSEPLSPPGAVDQWTSLLRKWSWAFRYVSLGMLFLVVYAMILCPVKKQVLLAFRQLPGKLGRPGREIPATAGNELAAGASIELPAGSEEARRAAALKKQLTDKVKAEPKVEIVYGEGRLVSPTSTGNSNRARHTGQRCNWSCNDHSSRPTLIARHIHSENAQSEE